ncbi:WD repeat and FYVE domain-containing protein 3 isoform X2 [Sabethes cyaneus]|uniref:WD repeat and FYVE domain-containing protein 3 isoform X2 n=1 Tax=Sabethes cyaneus TaxID=53552 RepID=UPI00237DE5FC|nr:WD repeat and FYVE domain-containing protein 3 isoform X2 [Sabethes cyaneus]
MSAHQFEMLDCRNNLRESSNDATSLGIMHLQKVFSEFLQLKDLLSDKEKESRLYNMLPLFCKTFESCPDELCNEFPNVVQYCQYLSKLMVAEIETRGSNQSTEAASKKIVEFLEINETEETSTGWMLLTAINIMANGPKSLVQVMTQSSIPSTLVKCLYLFFDLPALEEDDANSINSKFTSKKKRSMLQKLFVQVLVRLCSHPYPAEELARMDDLPLLFSAVTSHCPSYNVIWRKSAAEILMTLSRHGLTTFVVRYLHEKGCVSLCVDNMQRSSQLQPLEVVEMVVSVFCFLKDSSEVSQTLLDDFKACQGYLFLVDFLLKFDQEEEKSPDTEAAIRNLVLITTSLCVCGYNELKVPLNNNLLFQMHGFKMPQISARGTCVRNLHAFQVLQTVFQKSEDTSLCCIILEAISSVYHSDNANYFILESQNTLCQFSEIIHKKTPPVRERFFSLLEFIVFQLNFVPCKELISLSLLLKSNHSVECSILCMKTFLNLLKHNSLFCDVYREVGILEVFVNCLKKYKIILETDSSSTTEDGSQDHYRVLGEMILEAFVLLLSGNNNNATVFRDSGGSKCIHDMLHFENSRTAVLKIIREMMLNAGGDDEMLRLITTMQNASLEQIRLKIHILKLLISCLRDSHRTRTIFRKVNGFSYLINTLGDLKGKFSHPVDITVTQQYLYLLGFTCQALTTAMRFEPANAKFFLHELCYNVFYDAIRALGCFSSTTILKECDVLPVSSDTVTIDCYSRLFAQDISTLSHSIPEPKSLSFVCIIFRVMYNIALDSFENNSVTNIAEIDIHKNVTISDKSNDGNKTIKSTLNLTSLCTEPIIVHPGIVLCMLLLLPSVEHSEHAQKGLDLRYYLAEILKSLVRSERNQQIMCEAGMAGSLLKFCKAALLVEQHSLHLPLQYIFERLAVQALQPKEFREFLRLGFCTEALGVGSSTPISIPLTRIKTLVSMTTPRDFRAHGSYTLPPFVEIDMSSEGFGCIFLPSLAPQALLANSTETDGQAIGGIGTGDRNFPPMNGLSYSTWFCVEKFGDSRVDPHCVRLLTIVRAVNKPREENYVCFTILLSSKDKAIIASTQPFLLEQSNVEQEPDYSEEFTARVWCPDLLIEGQWHHLVVVINKLAAKNSSFSLFIDGHHMHTQKIQYITPAPGTNFLSNTSPTSSVYAYIGTPPALRRYSRLCWKQGVCHLVEDVFNQSIVSKIYALGPHYLGSLQAPHTEKVLDDAVNPLVPEERVLFGLNARAVSNLTLSKIRKIYSRLDCKAIAKQLGMNSHDNATPIKVLHNSAGHLAGPARTLGGVMIGYLGIRCFSPNPVSAIIYTVGGCSVLLGIIAMSQNVESLYAGVKALTCVLKSNKSTQSEMDRKRYYQTLGMIFKRKKHLLNSHILHLTFNLVGTVNSGQETSAIPNIMSFQDLLCDFEIWLGAPNELLKSLLEHLFELASESSEKRTNIRIMRDMQCISKLLLIVDEIDDQSSRDVLYNLLEVLLGSQPRVNDLLLFGQHLVCNIPQPGNDCDRNMNLTDYIDATTVLLRKPEMYKTNTVLRNIILRNRGLCLLHGLLFTTRNTVNTILTDEISKVLGTDWLMQFMMPHLHSSTVIWALRILVVLCANDIIITRLRGGTMNSGYMRNTEVIGQSKDIIKLSSSQATALPSNTKNSEDPILSLITKQNEENKTCYTHCSGFSYLEWLLLHHINIPEIYFLLTALMMGQPVKVLGTEHVTLDLDKIWTFLWGTPVSSALSSSILPKMTLCPEAVCIMLSIIRKIVHTPDNAEWLNSHPITLIQVLFSLYHNLPDFMAIVMSPDVIHSLIGVIFPYPITSTESEASSISSTSEELSYHVLQKCSSNQDKQDLTSHPVRKFVIDFLRVVAVDSFSLACSGKNLPIIDCILDDQPDNDSFTARCTFITEIITTLMDHLLAADILVGEQAALPIVPLLQSHVQNIAPNVFYLSARIVDKLWQGSLSRDPHEVFEFIIKLISQAKRRSTALSLDQLYHSLNRCILYLISRSTDSVSDQMMVMEALHKLTTNRLIIFGAGNHELEFIGCLAYCLMQLTANEKIAYNVKDCSENVRTTTWHVNPINNIISINDEDSLNRQQGINLIANAASRVWEELYVCKKPAIEEVFKITLTMPPNNAKAPDMIITREQILDGASKLWLSYLDGEKKALYKVPWDLHNNIQSKIQKVTGNLTRLASRTKVKKDDQSKEKSDPDMETIYQLNLVNLYLVKEFWEMRSTQHLQTAQHTQRYVYQEWLQSESELFRERGLWGAKESNDFTKWMLDTTEGPYRMRKKMIKNDLFYTHYPYRPEMETSDQACRQMKYKVATSLDSRKYYLSKKNVPNVLSLQTEQELGTEPLNRSDKIGKSLHDNEQGYDMEDDDELSSTLDNQTLLRLLEEKEKISHIFRCARIQGLDTYEGLILFGKEHCYVIDGFTLLKNREIRDIDSLSCGSYEPILPNPGNARISHQMRQSSKFAYEEIREVHKRRYLLQPIALEIFSGDGRNFLLSFPRKVRNKVYQRIMSMATSIADNAQQSVAGQSRTANVEQSSSLLSSLIGETSVTQRWVRGEISNFQYLMHLNTLAGRSYNDLMQYPVFPWILADYESERLDLSDPKSFRDFSKPMGAQSKDRLQQFEKRYHEWDDPHGETPPYFYGTHYSSAMIVCSYLVRMEPFTQHFLRLQGGHFDLADRMFHSIKEAWHSASKHNMADVKELIPEFFYLPEFLLNANSFDFGMKQNGEILNHVVLPPWSKGDPREFIRLHREALESDYVSQHLHLWIDLIFGYKQRGQAAVESVNVFHHLFYEGNVDIYNIDDPLKKNATIGFINNFGQIPKQLFRKAHPAKRVNLMKHSALESNSLSLLGHSGSMNIRLFFHNLESLKSSSQAVKELKGPVGHIIQMEKFILAVEQNKILMPPNFNRYIAWGYADHSIRVGIYDSDRALFVCENVAPDSGEILACACPNAKTIIMAGTNSILTVCDIDFKQKQLFVKHTLHGHTDAVTCLTASTAFNIIVSGSKDRSAIIWDMSRYKYVRQLSNHVGVVAAVSINELTGDIATCSATWLYVWSINGDCLAKVNTSIGSADRMQQILCVIFSCKNEWDKDNVIITGSTDGVVRIWSLDHVQIPCERQSCSDAHLCSEDPLLYEEVEEAGGSAFDIGSVVKSSSISTIVGHNTDENPKDMDNCNLDTLNIVSNIKAVSIDRQLNKLKSIDDRQRIHKDETNNSRSVFRWIRQLIFRTKLTMHTAYDRKDNIEPASITSLAISNDHRTIFVGDARGRIFSWSVTDQVGRNTGAGWLKDGRAETCVGCNTGFNRQERKIYCKNCGQQFCSKCCHVEPGLFNLRIRIPARICNVCYSQLKETCDV